MNLDLYIKNYKGGRNESLMYGKDFSTVFYDLDLTSAYTTVLYNIGSPDYQKAQILNKVELDQLMKDKNKIVNSFLIIKCDFVFPENIKYPSIPVFVNETTTVYPLQGKGILTGAEYLLALSQGCKITIDTIFHIPFSESIRPFDTIIKEIQSKRREYAKGTISNLMYKEIGNSIYGTLVRGINDKRTFDNKTGEMVRIPSSELSNPILASWVTAYIRSIVGECLQAIQDNNGSTISVTTDGFITNINNLEEIMSENKEKYYLFNEFKSLRKEISGDSTGLEVKSSGKGILSWTTRGQFGLESDIIATTGFQRKGMSKKELFELFEKTMENSEKVIEYTQTSLRSATDISKKVGHVVQTYRDSSFTMKYDNRRIIVDNIFTNLNNSTKKEEEVELLLTPLYKESPLQEDSILLDSKPFTRKEECANLRYMSKRNRVKEYNSITSLPLQKVSITSGKNYKSLAIRQFIKLLYSDNETYMNLRSSFKNYNELVNFIKSYDNSIKITKQSISNLLNRKVIHKQILKNEDTLSFISYVKTRFPDFKDDQFFVVGS
jgi:hypothetical protein